MKKNNWITLFIKGFIIGLGIIFPVSASVLAISMGMYTEILNYINDFWHNLKKNFSFILWLGLGILVSCIVSCLLLDYTLNKFPIATLLFFVGLIIGGLPLLFSKVRGKNVIKNGIFSILGIGLIITMSLISSNKNVVLALGIKDLLTLFIVGVVGAGSMIVPGVSGSVVLILLGYYEPILRVISELFNLTSVVNNFIIVSVFGIGMIIGVVIMSKLMAMLLKKSEIKTYFAIIGFVLASIINLVITLFGYNFNLIELIVGIILFIIGFMLSFKYLKEE